MKPVHIFIATAASLLAIGAATAPALASPSAQFVCYGTNDDYSARINFDEEWTTAFVEDNNGTFELRADPGVGGPQGAFSFTDGNVTFRGLGVEGDMSGGKLGQVQCWQTGDSQKAIALYGGTSPNWSHYNAPGEGFQTVRAGPDLSARKLASLPAGSPVTIIENTDKFYKGYYWYRITYDGGKQGYIWGALLCSDANNPELNHMVRRCN